MRGVKKLVVALTGVLSACSLIDAPTSPTIPTCENLPQEARETISLVQQGGPFPYPDNDNARFGNYEGVLPDEDLGYYREFTVDTPGVSHRGARRIITGSRDNDGGAGDETPEVWYYTADHYESFCQVEEVQDV